MIVVDNAGDQQERAGIDRLVTPGENLGFAAGSNLGAAHGLLQRVRVQHVAVVGNERVAQLRAQVPADEARRPRDDYGPH